MFVPGMFYYLNSRTEGVSIGLHNGAWKLYRVVKREDGEMFHYAVAVFPSGKHANIMMELFEDLFGPVQGDHMTVH